MSLPRQTVTADLPRIWTVARVFLLLIAPWLCGCGGEAGGKASASELSDFLIQDVCVDDADRAISEDPASCPFHRNIKVGEPTPYILTDFDRQHAIAYQSVNSVPVMGTDGELEVLVRKSLRPGFTATKRLDFSPKTDAFDLIDLNHSPYASIIRTFDGGCSDQIFSRSSSATSLNQRAGGWVLFPLSPPPAQWPHVKWMRVTTWRIQLSRAPAACATNHGTGITAWYAPALVTFEFGKRLTAIRTDHFAAADLSQPENSFERFYFTREYGLSRWESWWTVAYCRKKLGPNSVQCTTSVNNPLDARCRALAASGRPSGIQTYGGQPWVRMDCRDLTNWVALATPQSALSRQDANQNGMKDIDYRRTLKGSRVSRPGNSRLKLRHTQNN